METLLGPERLRVLESGKESSNRWQRAWLHPKVRAQGQLCAKTQAQVPNPTPSPNAVEPEIGLTTETVRPPLTLFMDHVL